MLCCAKILPQAELPGDGSAQQQRNGDDAQATDLDGEKDHGQPNSDQWVAVSTVISPVTVTADTAVKIASGNAVARPFADAMGSTRSAENAAAAARRRRPTLGPEICG